MKKLGAVLSTIALVSVGGASAQSENSSSVEDKWDVYGNLGYSFEGRTGFELEAGVKYRPAAWIEFGASPANLIFYENEDDQFESETFSNGQKVCRDSSNGQFTNEENCGPDTAWRGTVTGEFNISSSVSIGGGYLFGDQSAGFGSLRYNFSQRVSAQGRIGSDYGSIAVSLRF